VNNLGLYKTFTTVAKKVGGPGNLLAAVAASGYVVLRGAEAGGKKAVKTTRAARKKRSAPVVGEGSLFQVTRPGSEGRGGLTLRQGDAFRVLECDGDAVLIELLGNPDNPFFVSGQFLQTVSNFSAKDAAPDA
jgi:hypothetical protein